MSAERGHRLVVFTNAVEGRESEFDDWYDHTHLAQVLALEGFTAVQRFELAPGGVDAPYRYLAIYEIEPGRLEAAQRALADALAEPGRPRLAPSDALAHDRLVWWFSETGDRVVTDADVRVDP